MLYEKNAAYLQEIIELTKELQEHVGNEKTCPSVEEAHACLEGSIEDYITEGKMGS